MKSLNLGFDDNVSMEQGIFHSLFQSETARTNLFLGYFAHIVRRERDGIIAKDL